MELSSKSEYGLLAMLELAACHGNGEPAQIRQIALQQNIPDRYLEQLLATLRRAGLIRSERGAKGGYFLARKPWEITVLDVVVCMQGSEFQRSEKETDADDEGRRAISEIWQESQQAAGDVLQKYTLQDLLEKRDARRQLDMMYYI
ncbi:MAG: Rrf2 family transcriptional regulator [Oculatellaceae cyanobacterium Prado106]|jgi:Rrf2 family protein|nr:Rrf2 family transcriptional regulator [Oculatellaceae cyanobacterium Prado106]